MASAGMQEEGALLTEEEQPPALLGGRARVGPLILLVTLVAAGIVLVLSPSPKQVSLPVTNEVQEKAVYVATQTTQFCYGYTGGSCTVNGCDDWRHATCKMGGKGGSCVCDGTCAGADGQCYPDQSNTLVASGFTLTNFHWSKYSMYFKGITVFGQMKTTKAFSVLNMGKDLFTLYKLPGNATSTRYLLGSIKYPTKVATVQWTKGTAISGHGLYSTDLTVGKGVDELSVTVCYEPKKQAIMIGNKQGTYWAYCKHATWLVYASSAARNKVGDRGYWVPYPAMTPDQISMLPRC